MQITTLKNQSISFKIVQFTHQMSPRIGNYNFQYMYRDVLNSKPLLSKNVTNSLIFSFYISIYNCPKHFLDNDSPCHVCY